MSRARGCRWFQTISAGGVACAAVALTGCSLIVGTDPARGQFGDDAGGVLDPLADGSSPDPTVGADGAAQQDGTTGATPQPTDDAASPGADALTTLMSDAPLAGQDASMPGVDGSPQTGGGSPQTGGGTDAAPDSPSTAGDAGSVCAATIPPGWSPAIFNTGFGACPAGFAEHAALGTPTVGAGACSCACSVTQAGACGQGSLTLSEAPGHGVDTCSVPWFTTTVSGSQCIGVPAASQGAFEAYQATLPSGTGQGGACSNQAQSNPAALSEPPERFCDVPATSADAVCAGNAPAGFSACIVAAGTLACPSSTPFVHSFTVEDSATILCSSCSACSVSTTCSTATIAAFTSANCAAPAALTFNVDGTCVGTGNEVTILSLLYSANASATCTAGSSSASVQMTGAKTICCR